MQIEMEKILTGHLPQEKAAYLGALASLATADRHAGEEEINHLKEMSSAAGLPESETKIVLDAANDSSGKYLLKCLNTLKTSELRYSLVTDLIALAKADDHYTEDEKENIQKVSRYLDVNTDQFSVLDQYIDKAAEAISDTEEITKPESLGMKSKFSEAGINLGSIGKGLIGMLGPMILGGIAARSLGGSRGSGGNVTGMGLPGNLGGSGGFGGGLGSLISGMTRSRNNQTMGSLLGRLLK